MSIAIQSQSHSGGKREPIPGYVLKERLGAGGYGEVWKADAPGGLQKAVKLVYGVLSDARAAREMKALERIRQVNHPMLLSLERIEVVDDHLIVVTELADMSLRDCFERYLAEGRSGIPRAELLTFLLDAADGLDYLYEKHSLQHLDVKPENLLVVGGRVKVADFGMIKDLHDQNVSIVGGLTPLYAAPELFEGRPNRHSDQYSLAILYQELLTGQLPFEGRTPAQLAIQQLQGAPVLSPLPRLDQPIIARALSKNPDQRFAKCRTLIEQLVEASKSDRAGGKAAPLRSAPLRQSTSQLADDTISVKGETVDGNVLPFLHPSDVQVSPAVSLGSTDQALRPTLVVGVGGTAVKVMAEIRQRLREKFGELERLPSFRFLAIDTDVDDLPRAVDGSRVDWRSGESVAMPLRSASEYRELREPLLEWISRRWLYNIPRTLRTEGMRPLGRLAFVDHFTEVQHSIRQALSIMMNADSLQQTQSHAGLSLDPQSPEIVLIGNVAGGTASGSLLDIAYTIRTELQNHRYADRLRLVCLHCTNRRSARRDLSIANTSVFLQELSDFTGEKGRYPGEPTCGIPAFDSSNSHFGEATFIHLGDELDDETYAAQIHRLSEILCREHFEGCSSALRQWRPSADESAALSHVTLQTVAMSTVTSVMGKVPSILAQSLISQLMARWIHPESEQADRKRPGLNELDAILSASDTEEHNDSMECVARECLVSANLRPAELERSIQGALPQMLGCSPDEYWQEFLRRVLNDNGDPHGGVDVDLAIQRITGRPHARDDRMPFEPLVTQLEKKAAEIVAPAVDTVIDAVHHLLDTPGKRLHAALQAAKSLRREFMEWVEVLQVEINDRDAAATELLQIAKGQASSAARSEKRAATPEVRRRAWRELANHHQHWAELSAARYAIRTLAAKMNATIDQLSDLARNVRSHVPQVAPPMTPADLDSHQAELCAWAKDQESTWLNILDWDLHHKLAIQQRALSQLTDPTHELWSQWLDLLRESARQIVSTAILARSLELESAADGEDRGVKTMQQLIHDAVPMVSHCGGTQRWALIVPPDSLAITQEIQSAIRDFCGEEGSVIHDPSGTCCVCCHMNEIPLDNVIRALFGSRRELLQVAERLHTRTDVRWTSIA